MQTYAKYKLSHSFVSIKKCILENFVGVILLWSNILQYTIYQYNPHIFRQSMDIKY